MVAVPLSELEKAVAASPAVVLAVMGIMEARTTLAKGMLHVRSTGPVRQSVETDFGDVETANLAARVLAEHFEVETAKVPPGYRAKNIVRVIGTSVLVETEVCQS